MRAPILARKLSQGHPPRRVPLRSLLPFSLDAWTRPRRHIRRQSRRRASYPARRLSLRNCRPLLHRLLRLVARPPIALCRAARRPYASNVRDSPLRTATVPRRLRPWLSWRPQPLVPPPAHRLPRACRDSRGWFCPRGTAFRPSDCAPRLLRTAGDRLPRVLPPLAAFSRLPLSRGRSTP